MRLTRACLSFLSTVIITSCALPRPASVERQDFVSKRDVLVAKLVNQAQTDYMRGRYLDTEGSLRKALALVPDTTQVALNLARVLAKNGQIAESEKIFNKILLRKPKDIALINFIGETLFEAGEYEKAEYFFKQSLTQIEAAKVEQKELDIVLVQAAQRNQAVAAFRRSNQELALCLADEIFVKTPNPDSLVALLRLELAFGRFSQVENRVNAYLVSNPGAADARIYLMRALSRFGQGAIDKGKEDLAAAQNRDASIGDYSLELLLLTEAYIHPEAIKDGEEQPQEEELISLQELTPAKRLFLPALTLKALDDKLAEKRIRYQELGLSE